MLLLELLAGRPDRRSGEGQKRRTAGRGRKPRTDSGAAEDAGPTEPEQDGRQAKDQDRRNRARTNGRTAEDRRSNGAGQRNKNIKLK